MAIDIRHGDPNPQPDKPVVRVTLPAKVAYDLNAFQKVQASILDRLGCQACCSGWDIRFDLARSYLVDEKLNVREILGGGVIIDG